MIFKLLNGAASYSYTEYWHTRCFCCLLTLWLNSFRIWITDWTLKRIYKCFAIFNTKSLIFDKNQWKSVWSKPKSTPFRQTKYFEILAPRQPIQPKKGIWFSVVLKLRPLYIHERATWKVDLKTNLLYI